MAHNGTTFFDLSTMQQACFWMELTVYPLLLTICTAGNVLIVKVANSHLSPRNGSVYLTAMAISGLFVLWLELPIFSMTFVVGTDAQLSFDCLTTSILHFYLGLYKFGNCAFTNLADWALIMFAVDWVIRATWSSIRLSTLWTKLCVSVLATLSGFLALENAVGHFYRHDTRNETVTVPQWLNKWDTIQNEAVVSFQYAGVHILRS